MWPEVASGCTWRCSKVGHSQFRQLKTELINGPKCPSELPQANSGGPQGDVLSLSLCFLLSPNSAFQYGLYIGEFLTEPTEGRARRVGLSASSRTRPHPRTMKF